MGKLKHRLVSFFTFNKPKSKSSHAECKIPSRPIKDRNIKSMTPAQVSITDLTQLYTDTQQTSDQLSNNLAAIDTSLQNTKWEAYKKPLQSLKEEIKFNQIKGESSEKSLQLLAFKMGITFAEINEVSEAGSQARQLLYQALKQYQEKIKIISSFPTNRIASQLYKQKRSEKKLLLAIQHQKKKSLNPDKIKDNINNIVSHQARLELINLGLQSKTLKKHQPALQLADHLLSIANDQRFNSVARDYEKDLIINALYASILPSDQAKKNLKISFQSTLQAKLDQATDLNSDIQALRKEINKITPPSADLEAHIQRLEEKISYLINLKKKVSNIKNPMFRAHLEEYDEVLASCKLQQVMLKNHLLGHKLFTIKHLNLAHNTINTQQEEIQAYEQEKETIKSRLSELKQMESASTPHIKELIEKQEAALIVIGQEHKALKHTLNRYRAIDQDILKKHKQLLVSFTKDEIELEAHLKEIDLPKFLRGMSAQFFSTKNKKTLRH